jgi:hypothetical protein
VTPAENLKKSHENYSYRCDEFRPRLPLQLRQSATHGPRGHGRAIREFHLLSRSAPIAEDGMEEKKRS